MPSEQEHLDDLAGLGWALLSFIAVVKTAGHTSPAGTLYYAHGAVGHGAIVADFAAWSGDPAMRPGCRDRLFALLHDGEIEHINAELAHSRIKQSGGWPG